MFIWIGITCLLLFCYLVLLLLYRLWWSRLEPLHVPAGFEPITTFSIIVPARNEEKNIEACINSILHLNYPAHLFELIVIDDFSEDETAALVNKYPTVQLIQLKDHISSPINSYKKKGIETGIGHANHEYIVTTDADCTVPVNWLRNFAFIIQNKRSVFISAPVAMNDESTFLQLFQSLDFLSLQGITAASVGAGVHSMCNGANLCYSKEAFEQVEGFKQVDHIASGDDMLLMHKIYKKFPGLVHYCHSAESIVLTQPETTVKRFFMQRIRWASKADKYDDKRIFVVLLLVYGLNFCMLASALAGFVDHTLWLLFLAAFFFKTVTELWFLLPVAAFFQKQELLFWFPVAQPFHIVYTVIAGWLGKFGQYKWKGRSVK